MRPKKQKVALVGFAHDSGDWISRSMARATFGRYSHMVIVSPDGKNFIEATGTKRPSGVQPPQSISDFLARENATIRQIAHPNPEGIWRAALSQIRKRYDWGWLVGWLLRNRRLGSRNRWVCSELFGWAAREAGDPLIEGDHDWHLSPNDWYLLSKELT